MPYSYPDNIPDAIKKLPTGGQKIFVSAYNAAHKQYEGDEAKANATAWAAVKTKYEKVNDKWRKKAMETWRYIDLLEGMQFSDAENPTSEVQLFKIGKWKGHPTGGFEITEEIIGKMIENFEAGERDVVVDYQHMSLDGGPDEAKAAGWVKKLVNKGKGGLWATVEWTKKAAEMIKEKEYRYISPEFHLNYPSKETKKKLGAMLMAVALTNRPFLEGMAPVALSERALAEIENVSLDEILGDINAWLAKAAPQIKGKKGSPAIRLYLRGVKEKLKELIKKSKTKSLAEESLDDRRNKVSSAYRKRFVSPYEYSGICHWVKEVFDTYVIAERDGKFLKVLYTIKDGDVEFGDPVEVEQVYQEKNIKSTEGGVEMDRKLLCAQLGLSETATDNEISAELKRLTELQDNKALTESLGLKEQATELEVLEAVKKLKEAGSQSAAEGIVKLADFQRLEAEHAGTKKLAGELKVDRDALSKKLLEKDRDEVIGKALAEGRLVDKDGAKAVWEARFMGDPDNTRKLLATLQPVVDFKERGSGGGGPTGNAGEQLNIKCSEKMTANPKLSYRDAFSAVQTENPVLSKEYAKECNA